MYADTDFFVALVKGNDWLSKRAFEIYREFQNDISTSPVSVVELLWLSNRYGIDPEKLMAAVYTIAKVEGLEMDFALSAAHLMKNCSMSACDALHASLCGGNIISSDKVFDTLGISRVKLKG